MECLYKNADAFYKVVEFKETNSIKTSKSNQEKDADDYQILALEQTIEILQEQIETLKQELQYEQQLVEEYDQELRYTHSEMSVLNCEVQNLYNLEKLNFAKAKFFAQSILNSDKSISESLAQLLSGIYGVLVTADDLEQTTAYAEEPQYQRKAVISTKSAYTDNNGRLNF